MPIVMSSIFPDSIHMSSKEFEKLPENEQEAVFTLGCILRKMKRSMQTAGGTIYKEPLAQTMLVATFDAALDVCKERAAVNEIMCMAERLGTSGFRFIEPL